MNQKIEIERPSCIKEVDLEPLTHSLDIAIAAIQFTLRSGDRDAGKESLQAAERLLISMYKSYKSMIK